MLFILRMTLNCAIAEGDCACVVDECSCVVQSESPACATFSEFKLLSHGQVAELVRRAAAKSCPLDPRPTSVVLQVHDLLLPVLTWSTHPLKQGSLQRIGVRLLSHLCWTDVVWTLLIRTSGPFSNLLFQIIRKSHHWSVDGPQSR